MQKTAPKQTQTQFKLQGLSNSELKDFVHVSRLLSEEWAFDLLKHAAGPHSPIDVDSLPHSSKSESLVISALHAFEDRNLLHSRFERRGNTIRRVFHITPLGKRVVSYTP